MVTDTPQTAELATAKRETDSQRDQSFGLRQLVAGDLLAWARIWNPAQSQEERVPFHVGVRLVWNYCGLRATLLYRLSHALWKAKIPVLPGMVARLNLMLHGFDVPCTVEIGPGLYVPHPVGTAVMAQRIGRNVSMISCITIGMRNVRQFPVIGDGVVIGAGARILGGVIVGDYARIGANAVVIKDVPVGATAVGVPARNTFPKAADE